MAQQQPRTPAGGGPSSGASSPTPEPERTPGTAEGGAYDEEGTRREPGRTPGSAEGEREQGGND